MVLFYFQCRDHPVSSKSLLGVLRRTDNKEELFAFRQITKHEIKVHNSKDTVDKDGKFPIKFDVDAKV